MGGGGGIGNKAQLRPAKLELGLGLSLAKILEFSIKLAGWASMTWFSIKKRKKISMVLKNFFFA